MEDQSAVAKSTRMKGPTRVEVIDKPNTSHPNPEEKSAPTSN